MYSYQFENSDILNTVSSVAEEATESFRGTT